MTKFDALNSRSDETEDRHIAGKAVTQYEDFGITAGNIALSRDTPRIRMLAGSLSTMKPVRILVAKSIIIMVRIATMFALRRCVGRLGREV
jgi:hypothetical protein